MAPQTCCSSSPPLPSRSFLVNLFQVPRQTRHHRCPCGQEGSASHCRPPRQCSGRRLWHCYGPCQRSSTSHRWAGRLARLPRPWQSRQLRTSYRRLLGDGSHQVSWCSCRQERWCLLAGNHSTWRWEWCWSWRSRTSHCPCQWSCSTCGCKNKNRLVNI